ncbi:MAG: hypothetical protein KatS3mg108_3117 [Isosphaeraceae bacterium]|jgi:hypothetical protein|nr:MAG: hypothetical protein KatS3mg108_3117 [Isosphaeraceae bacterium]
MPRLPSSTAAALIAGLLSGCSAIPLRDHTLIPTAHRVEVGPYVIHSNFPLPDNAPAVVELTQLRREIESVLATSIDPGPGSIEVYILDDSRTFAHFLNTYYNELPHRRAFFLAQGDRRVIYTFLGDRLTEDLRHEATHALLHCLIPELPLWIDEGLAEFFEDRAPTPGTNPDHLQRLADEIRRWRPDLPRLESIHDVRSMTPRDYREAWAWVHFLATGSPARRLLLASYLHELRSASPDSVTPLSERIATEIDDPNRALLAHIRNLIRASHTASTPSAHETVRLQSPHPRRLPDHAPPPGSSRPPRTQRFRLGDLLRPFARLLPPSG